MSFELLKNFFLKKTTPNFERSKFVFISHDEADASFVHELSDYLKSQELPPLVDRSATESCAIKIKECDVFILVMSTSSRKSIQIAKEIEMALSHNKLIIPLSLNNQLFAEFENVQAGNGSQLYSLSLELAERLRQLLTPTQIPAKAVQKRRIEYIVILLFESIPFGNEPILYDGKKLMVDHNTILRQKLDYLDELDWLEFFVVFERVFTSERYCQANYNSTRFPALQHLVDYFFNKLSWEEIKDIRLIGLKKNIEDEDQ